MMIERVDSFGPMVTDTPGTSTFDVPKVALGAFGMSQHHFVSCRNRLHRICIGSLYGLIGAALLDASPLSVAQESGVLRLGPPQSEGGAPIAGDLSASPWSSRLPAPHTSRVHWGALRPIDPSGPTTPPATGLDSDPRRGIPTRSVSNTSHLPTEFPSEGPTAVTIANPWVGTEQAFSPEKADLFPSTPFAQSSPEEAARRKRELLAQQVSQNLLQPSGPAANENDSEPLPQALERPAGWGALEVELRSGLEKCDQLLRRGAVHSARDEVVLGLRKLMRTMDLIRGAYVSEPALDKALNALREELDFLRVGNGVSVASIVATHSTEALKNRPLDTVSPSIASQHYRSHARKELLIAADEHPWAADLLYALGKTFEKEAEQNTTIATSLRSQAVICYQAAVQLKPNHTEASNQLGHTLLLLDRVDEALISLNNAVQINPSSASWSNLAEAYKRSGAHQQAVIAAAKANEWQKAAKPTFSRSNPEVIEISPEEFARFSPAQNSFVASAPASMAAPNQAAPQRATTPVKTASRFSNLFR